MKKSRIRKVASIAIPVLTAGFFFLHWLTPVGVVDWVLYFIPLLLSFYASARFSPIILATVFSVLIGIEFYNSPPGLEPNLALANLLLGLGTLWMVALLVARLQRSMNQVRRLSATVEQSPASIVITDPQGGIEYVNPKFCAITGYSFEEVRGKNPRVLKSGTIPSKTYKELWATISAGRDWHGEFYNQKKNGGFYWELASISPIKDDIGNITQYLAVKEDITTYKKASAALLESERFLEATLDALSAHIAILNEEGVIIAVNAAWKQFAHKNKYRHSDYGIGINYLDLCDRAVGDYATEAPTMAGGIRTVIAGQRSEFFMEYPCHSKEEQRWFMGSITRFAGDGPVRVVVAHENITARKRMEEELQRETAFLEAQMNSSIDGILVVDDFGNKILQNQRMTDLLKIPQSIVDDKNDMAQREWVAQTAQNPEQFLETIRSIHSHRNEISRDEIEMKDGMVLDRYSAPMFGKDGKYYGRMWTFRDITERKRIAQELAEHKLKEEEARLALEHEQRLSQIKSRFVSMVSHEFRTPLAIINGAAGLLDVYSDNMTGAERSEHVKEIESAVERMAQLMNDFLLHGNCTSGKLECKPARVEVEALCQRLISEMPGYADSPHLIECVVDSAVGRAFLDKKILRHILGNLLSNAVK